MSFLISCSRSPARSPRRRCSRSWRKATPVLFFGGFASNGYGDLSPGHYNLLSCAVIETVLTFFFLIVILGATSAGAPAGFAGLAIGLTLTLIHLIRSRWHQHLGSKSRAQHRPGDLRRQSLYRTALVLLAGADRGRRCGRYLEPVSLPQARLGSGLT